MPRKGRGGARNMTPGQPSANRTDMIKQPVRVAPSTEYGQGVQSQASQQAVPLPDNAAAMAQMVQAAAQNPGAPVAGSPVTQQVAPPVVGLGEPSARPGEPVTHGIGSGPGAGPEALDPNALRPNLASTIAQLAQASGNQTLMALAQRAQAQQQGQ